MRRGGAAATGWVYVLAVPIGVIALYMAAFAWLRLRGARAAEPLPPSFGDTV